MQKISGDDARAALDEHLGSGRYSRIYPAPDPEVSVRLDVELLRNSPVVPEGLSVTGFVYDVKTGRLRQVSSG